MSQAVAERLAEARRVDQVARGGVDAGPRSRRARTASSPASWASRHDLVRARRARREAARSRTCACSRSSSRRPMQPASTSSVSPGSMRAVARARRAAWPRSGRTRHGTGNETPVRVRLVQELLEAPGELALGPADDAALVREAFERDVRDLGRAADRVELVLVLDRAQLLDEAVARDRLDPAGVQSASSARSERRRLEADASRRAARRGSGRDRASRRRTRRLDRACRLRVPEVGEEPHALGLDEERRVRAGETRQVADVRRVRDEERLLEALAAAVSTRPFTWRRRGTRALRGTRPARARGSASPRAARSRRCGASPRALLGFERCTSTIGPA